MKLKRFIAALLLPLNVLLLFFLLFEERLLIPAWLQVFGRLHPAILHFPIVLVLLYLGWLLFAPKSSQSQDSFKNIGEVLLLLSGFTAAITALMGFFLSREPGYDAGNIAWHKYTGIGTSFILFLLYSFRQWLAAHPVPSRLITFFTALIVIWAGHLGSTITHGEDFVLAPVKKDVLKKQVALEDALVYEDLVKPILEAKCFSCHNSKKSKGELVMETKELLIKGGKNGVLWDTAQQGFGLLMNRVHLPLDEKKHMPPSGKPQLTGEEISVLYQWIRNGSDFTHKVTELPEQDSLRMLASIFLKPAADEVYDFAAADESQIKKLVSNYRVITPLALGSPALVVTFYNRSAFDPKQLSELSPLAQQIVELNLDNMPVKDADLEIISQFKNLQKLNLNFSSVTGTSLASLKKIPTLKSISLSGSPVQPDQLSVLSSFPSLKHVYLWNTSITKNDLGKWQSKNKSIQYYAGFKGDDVVLKLTAPIFQNEEKIFSQPMPLQLKHYINGVNIRYTTDGKDPDSLSSPVYNNKVMLGTDQPIVTVKAKAFKEGWIGSDVMTSYFFKSTYTPDSIVLITQPDAKYKAKGSKTLTDHEKNELTAGSGKWLGYRNGPFVGLMEFPQPIEASNVTLSLLQDMFGYVLPPAKVEIWGGENKNNLKLLFTEIPNQPTKLSTMNESIVIDGRFKPTTVKYIKVALTPVAVLPSWHPGKGQKAWVFIDEVFVN